MKMSAQAVENMRVARQAAAVVQCRSVGGDLLRGSFDFLALYNAV